MNFFKKGFEGPKVSSEKIKEVTGGSEKQSAERILGVEIDQEFFAQIQTLKNGIAANGGSFTREDNELIKRWLEASPELDEEKLREYFTS